MIDLKPMNKQKDAKNTQKAGCSSATCSELPDSPGFYWWRETDRHEWRVVHVVSYGGDDPEYLGTYDVHHGEWRGRSIRAWREWKPPGQWVQINAPNAPEQP
jgi:hypothetical protein